MSTATMKNAFLDDKDSLVITAFEDSSPSDFDFLKGPHLVRHKKLRHRLADCHEWLEFSGTHTLETLLMGRGNLEQHVMQDEAGSPIEGIALRLFDPGTRLWTIHWSDSRSCRLDAPIIGSFDGPVGYFYGKDQFQGKSILVQFVWDAANVTHPVWSQAFSTDGGKSWEWNWYMYFEPVSAPASVT